MTDDFNMMSNITFWCAFAAWFIAQLLKFFFHILRTRQVDFNILVSTGGMPSSHSSLVSALATAVGLLEGFGSPVFAIAVVFAGVVMFDAQSVRRAAGTQARLLNQIVEELFKEHHLSENKLAELLGHTPLEVFFGMALGVATALCMVSLWLV